MANFGSIINWVLQLEDRGLRGNTVNLGDGAGYTRLGLTSKNFPNVPTRFWYGIDRMDNEEAIECAKQTYHDSYWTPLGLGELQCDELAATIMSFAVNDEGAGTSGRAVKLLQQALGVAVDGRFGLHTLGALLAADNATTAAKLREDQEQFYVNLVADNPSKSIFLDGWVKRARVVYPDLP